MAYMHYDCLYHYLANSPVMHHRCIYCRQLWRVRPWPLADKILIAVLAVTICHYPKLLPCLLVGIVTRALLPLALVGSFPAVTFRWLLLLLPNTGYCPYWLNEPLRFLALALPAIRLDFAPLAIVVWWRSWAAINTMAIGFVLADLLNMLMFLGWRWPVIYGWLALNFQFRRVWSQVSLIVLVIGLITNQVQLITML